MNVLRVAALSLAVLACTSARARIDVTLDAASLNGLLASMAPDRVDVRLAARTLTIRLLDLKVTGFDPTAGPNGGILTSVRLVVPDLEIDTALAPRLALDIAESSGSKVSYLRFDKVMVDLPLTGPVDIAALLPSLSLIPDGGWVVGSARGNVRVRPQLVDAKTGAQSIRLGFTLAVEPVAGGAR